MSTRFIVCFSIVVVAAAAGAAGARGMGASTVAPSVRASLVSFPEVTQVYGHYLLGKYVVVHDEGKMARGEPCTTFYKVKKSGPPEAVVSFHCVPRRNGVVNRMTVTTQPPRGTTTSSPVVELVEYQIAGETEAHGVPQR